MTFLLTWQAFWRLVWKDMRVEFRGKQILIASVAFGVLLMFVTGMALDGQGHLPANWTVGLLWLDIFFSTAMSMTRQDMKDREYNAWQGLVLAPFDRSLVYYAKWFSTLVFVTIAVVVITAVFFVVFNQPTPVHPWWFVLSLIGGTVGLTGIGTFLVTLLMTSTMRDLLLPLLLFPLCIPLFLALVRLSLFALTNGVAEPLLWAEVLCGYIVVFAVLPWLLYETLTEV